MECVPGSDDTTIMAILINAAIKSMYLFEHRITCKNGGKTEIHNEGNQVQTLVAKSQQYEVYNHILLYHQRIYLYIPIDKIM